MNDYLIQTHFQTFHFRAKSELIFFHISQNAHLFVFLHFLQFVMHAQADCLRYSFFKHISSPIAVVQLRSTTVHSKSSTEKNQELESKTEIFLFCFSLSIPNQMRTSNRRVCKVSRYSRMFDVEIHVKTKQIASNSCKYETRQ